MSDATATADAAKRHPPKPPFALTVGVVGHRPRDLAKDPPNGEAPAPREERLKKIEHDVAAALKAIKNAATQSREDYAGYFCQEAVLTLVSALAEGADTIAADVALNLGYELDAPLPFAREDYETDFETAKAKANLNRLLGRARGVLELPGRRSSAAGPVEDSRTEANRAYEAAGLTVLSQADILLAVWDGSLSRGPGGTAEMVAEAARSDIPIILVDAYGLRPIELRWRGFMPVAIQILAFDDLPTAKLESVYRVVDELVRPPSAPDELNRLRRWFVEYVRCINVRPDFPLLMSLLFVRRLRASDFLHLPPRDLSRLYVRDSQPVVAFDEVKTIAFLAEPYGWADYIAVHFAQLFRSAVVMNFTFAAMSVVAALTAVVVVQGNTFWNYVPVVVEVMLIFGVILNTSVARRGRWHHRWLCAREVAERLRLALPLWILGLRPTFTLESEPGWPDWYVRAFVRGQAMRSGNLGRGHLAAERTVLMHLLVMQRDYNSFSEKWMRRTDYVMELVGFCLLVGTAAVALDHLLGGGLVHGLIGRFASSEAVTVWLSAALPILAAGIYGIRINVDFLGIAHRAKRMSRRLNSLVAVIKQDPPDLAVMRARARSAAAAIMQDLIGWRDVAEPRELEYQ